MHANKELNNIMEEWNQNKINKFCAQRKIEWIFNPPSASHIGGVWERLKRSVRQVLRAVLKEQVFRAGTFPQLIGHRRTTSSALFTLAYSNSLLYG